MDTSYPIKHWFLAIVTAPLFGFFYEVIFTPYNESSDFIQLYFLFVLLGFIFSFPVILIYYFTFLLLIKKTNSALLIKVLLNILAIVSVFISFKLIGGSIVDNLTIVYSVSIIFWSFFLKVNLEPKLSKTPANDSYLENPGSK